MKFASFLLTLETDCPDPQLRGSFIKYKLLKQLLSACSQLGPASGSCSGSGSGTGACCPGCEARFFDALSEQLQAANRVFASRATKIVTLYNQLQKTPLCGSIFSSGQKRRDRLRTELARRAYWCRKYAKANAVALRKLLKKHDKLCDNARGWEFLQDCWRPGSQRSLGLFLHSPLLDELKAIQDVLQHQLPPGDSELGDAQQPTTPTKQAQQAQQAQRALQDGQRASQQQQQGQGQAQEGPQQQPGTSNAAAAQVAANGASEPAPARPALPQPLTVRTGRQELGGVGRGSLPAEQPLPPLALSPMPDSPTEMLSSADLEWCAVPGEVAPLPHERATPRSADGGGVGAETGWAGLGLVGADQQQQQEQLEVLGLGRRTPSEPGSVMTVGGSRNFMEEDLRCPICLDIMFRPVGLTCGHKFCRGCALAACGYGRTVGTLSNVCSYIPRRTRCPQCRQAGVYQGAVVLKEVGRLIEDRYPAHWAAREAEERELARLSRAEADARQRERLRERLASSRNPFERWLGSL